MEQSLRYLDPTLGELGDTFIAKTKAGGAEPFLTMPMVGWVAKTNGNLDTLAASRPPETCPTAATCVFAIDAAQREAYRLAPRQTGSVADAVFR